jgi:hypothetical protein
VQPDAARRSSRRSCDIAKRALAPSVGVSYEQRGAGRPARATSIKHRRQGDHAAPPRVAGGAIDEASGKAGAFEKDAAPRR